MQKIGVDNKMVHLGSFFNIQAAWLARRIGERIYFKEFRRINL